MHTYICSCDYMYSIHIYIQKKNIQIHVCIFVVCVYIYICTWGCVSTNKPIGMWGYSRAFPIFRGLSSTADSSHRGFVEVTHDPNWDLSEDWIPPNSIQFDGLSSSSRKKMGYRCCFRQSYLCFVFTKPEQTL